MKATGKCIERAEEIAKEERAIHLSVYLLILMRTSKGLQQIFLCTSSTYITNIAFTINAFS